MVQRFECNRVIGLVTSIYSVDFHPTENYVATAGGGSLRMWFITFPDSNILIWSTDPIFSEEKEDDENTDRLLSVLRGHSNVVTCCRWSPDGKCFLMGGATHWVDIWQAPRMTRRFAFGKRMRIMSWFFRVCDS